MSGINRGDEERTGIARVVNKRFPLGYCVRQRAHGSSLGARLPEQRVQRLISLLNCPVLHAQTRDRTQVTVFAHHRALAERQGDRRDLKVDLLDRPAIAPQDRIEAAVDLGRLGCERPEAESDYGEPEGISVLLGNGLAGSLWGNPQSDPARDHHLWLRPWTLRSGTIRAADSARPGYRPGWSSLPGMPRTGCNQTGSASRSRGPSRGGRTDR